MRAARHLRAVFVYSLEEGKPHQITDAMSDAVSPAFDAGGNKSPATPVQYAVAR